MSECTAVNNSVDDTLEQARDARYLAVQYAVARLLSESTDLHEAAPQILRIVGEGLGWNYGALWIVSPRDNVLRCTEVWTSAPSEFQQFETISRDVTLRRGVGLPGKVWSEAGSVYIEDVLRDTNFPRLAVAAREGLHSALSFPIIARQQVLGVIEFLSREARHLEPALLDLAEAVSSQIGQFIERRTVEESVRESEARKSAILESALDAIISMDADGRVIEFNPAAERIFGYSREEATGREMAELIIPPSLREKHREGLRRYLVTSEGPVVGNRLELTGMRSDASEFPVELTVTRVPLDGPPIFTGYIRDITERKRTESALRASETRFRTLVEQSPLSLQIFAPDGRLLQVNRAWEQLWGVTLDQITGYNVLRDPQLVEIDVMPYIERAFAGEVVAIPPSRYEPEKTIAGVSEVPYRWVRGIMYPIKDEGGSVYEVVVIQEDITEQKRAEEQREESLLQAAQALELRNQFLSIASHELKTPVTLMKGYAQLLYQRMSQEQHQSLKRPVEVINRQVGRMADLIDNLLDISRIESGKIQFTLAPFDLGKAVEDVVSEMRVLSQDVEFNVSQASQDVWVRGDQSRIEQVITNLLGNAVRYSDKQKEVDIRIRREGEEAVVSVTDYGIGIPKEQHEDVFGLYFRGHNVSSMQYGGLGLGLYISKSIVDRHGGRIWLESEQGAGSTFHFSLPLANSSSPR